MSFQILLLSAKVIPEDRSGAFKCMTRNLFVFSLDKISYFSLPFRAKYFDILKIMMIQEWKIRERSFPRRKSLLKYKWDSTFGSGRGTKLGTRLIKSHNFFLFFTNSYYLAKIISLCNINLSNSEMNYLRKLIDPKRAFHSRDDRVLFFIRRGENERGIPWIPSTRSKKRKKKKNAAVKLRRKTLSIDSNFHP